MLDFGLVKVTTAPRRAHDADDPRAHDYRHAGVHGAGDHPREANVDRRADVYALGCVAYYLLTGQLVFEADTPMKMLMQHVQAGPVPPSQRTELPIPRELDELVLACLEKDPHKRPQNAEELLRDRSGMQDVRDLEPGRRLRAGGNRTCPSWPVRSRSSNPSDASSGSAPCSRTEDVPRPHPVAR